MHKKKTDDIDMIIVLFYSPKDSIEVNTIRVHQCIRTRFPHH